MVTISSCLIWQIISFILPPNEYRYVYACIRFAKWACDRLTEDADFGKKNRLFKWSSFWSWRVCTYVHTKLVITTLQSPLMLCVLILYISGGTYSLKSTPNYRFFKKLFMEILFTFRVFARNLLRGNRQRNIFHILFWCLA